MVQYFDLPPVVERVVEIDISNVSKGKGNFSDTITHDACERLLSALRFNLKKSRDSTQSSYLYFEFRSKLREGLQTWIEENKAQDGKLISMSNISDNLLAKFVTTKFDPVTWLEELSLLVIDMLIPLIIVDESRGIIKAKLDNSYEITSFEDIGVCLYVYTSENAQSYKEVLENSIAIPILICSTSKLEVVIDIISNGLNQVFKLTQERLKQSPHFIAKEILFNKKILSGPPTLV
jgi:hypothetical protein